MKVLAIESSTRRPAVAVGEDGQLAAATWLPHDSRPTAALVPAIRDLCRSVGWSPNQLDLVCVDIGPGSYTGLRVGLACAKTLAFAAGAALATAESLEVTAHNAEASESLVEVAFDAARGQVFAGRFRRTRDAWSARQPVRIVAAEDWARQLDPSTLVLGPALARYRELLPPRHRVADEAAWWPRPEWVMALGWRQFQT
ncbi:MAG: tRNA (adenosine(37)-N6)-threonylcarbamoyltransferase complex dimerization subunit type 1 TsaB, partial [Terriglobia bacterium]